MKNPLCPDEGPPYRSFRGTAVLGYIRNSPIFLDDQQRKRRPDTTVFIILCLKKTIPER